MDVTRRTFVSVSAAAAALGTSFSPAWSAASHALPPASRGIRVIENQWIAMPDGKRLAARIFLPEDAVSDPVGAVLEYIPYKKRTAYRLFDDATAAWLVPRGFAYIRVDVRGTGESDGLIQNEYALPEQRDAEPLIESIAKQPWCNGNVGMRGISYGSITSIQAASKGIEPLKAIIPCVGTDNGYTDDVHTIDGCVINEKVIWGSMWKATMIDPPDPALVGGDWKSIWLNRLEAQIPLVTEWMRHQLVDQYWTDRIVTDFSSIKCGVYVLGGLMDSYIDTVPRLLENLNCPRKGIVGPWGHDFPHEGIPGPQLDWIGEEVRWWDYWLNDNDNGIMDEPMLHSFIADEHPTRHFPENPSGRWVSEPSWPSPNVAETTLFASSQSRLSTATGDSGAVGVPADVTIGTCIPSLSPYDMYDHAPVEQTPDDNRSLVFETEPLIDDLELLGQANLEFSFTSNRPVAKLAARLNEVTADGQSWLVSYGASNLSHEKNHTEIRVLEQGGQYKGKLQFHFSARRFRKGSRFRISLSQAQWPILWPTPELVDLNLLR
ncbi:MAG: CocE/NonD family hydrolase [Pacificimonas sp.]|jgi:putative CocE/NonD family hydrolase|nr:CocE/NonD family hydrolase [Pacificimonas sp.]